MKASPMYACALSLAILSAGLAPSIAFARPGDDDKHGKKHSKEHEVRGNSPKRDGRHDNGNHNGWYKQRDNHPNRSVWVERQPRPMTLAEQSRRRQQTKNEWRNIALVSGGVAILGLIKHDNRLVFAGSAGALYSLYRYEQDRKSQSSIDRLRAAYFGRPYFVRDGVRYDRRLVTKNGERYYQFARR